MASDVVLDVEITVLFHDLMHARSVPILHALLTRRAEATATGSVFSVSLNFES
jgi:hypothetical protein